jgi:hypothetical protein
MQYLTVYLKFDIGAREVEAISKFHELAARHGVIGGHVRAIDLYRGG